MLRTQEQLSLSASKAHKFVCTVIRTVEFYAGTLLLTGDIDEIKKEISQRTTQKNKGFLLIQTQYKITDQIHGKVCSHAFMSMEVVVRTYVQYSF